MIWQKALGESQCRVCHAGLGDEALYPWQWAASLFTLQNNIMSLLYLPASLAFLQVLYFVYLQVHSPPPACMCISILLCFLKTENNI